MRGALLIVFTACGGTMSGGDDSTAPDAPGAHDTAVCSGSWPEPVTVCDAPCVSPPGGTDTTCKWLVDNGNGTTSTVTCPDGQAATWNGQDGCCTVEDTGRVLFREC